MSTGVYQYLEINLVALPIDSSTKRLVNSNVGPLIGKSAVILPIEAVTDLERYLAMTCILTTHTQSVRQLMSAKNQRTSLQHS